MSRLATFPPINYSTRASKSCLEEVNSQLAVETHNPPRLASGEARRDAINALLDLDPRCREKNWNGDGADPISEAAFQEARTFLLKLPTTLPLPEVIAEPDGYIGLEWYTHKRQLYAVSFNGKGALSCSGLFGQSKTYGTWYMDDGIPSEILRTIAKIVQ